MFPAARRPGRRRRGPRGAGARGGPGARGGLRRARSLSRGSRPLPRPAEPGGLCSAVSRGPGSRAGGGGGGGRLSCLHRAAARVAGARVAFLRGPDRKSAALRAQLCLGLRDARGPSPAGAPLPFPSPLAPAARSPERRWAVPAAQLGVANRSGRVQFENRLGRASEPTAASERWLEFAVRTFRVV